MPAASRCRRERIPSPRRRVTACTAIRSLTPPTTPPSSAPGEDARPERREGSGRARSHPRGKPSRHVLDVLEELLPGVPGRLLLLLDALDRVRDGGLDVALVRSRRLRLQLQGRAGEDLSDGCIREERILELLHALALQQRRLARKVSRLLEDRRLGCR